MTPATLRAECAVELAALALSVAEDKAAGIMEWRWAQRRDLADLSALLRDLNQALRAVREALE